ncbi:hypothetical protein DICVIV_07762 [Dictyocaulus viviparus]|uniref:Uncharacterized protein n=1 Tax=Dictyocaulus viviparus TaxID=29172 RepID=A0A0D8XUU7_DICVI|nr:hypothetical protein DICVIV_07762 [Dictyocaulus viviparus]
MEFSVQVLSAVGFASKALGVATLITGTAIVLVFALSYFILRCLLDVKWLVISLFISVSGYSLFIIGVSWVLQVNTPRQFGSVMRQAFGDSLRLPQSQNSQTFEELVLSIQASQQPR